MKAESAARKKSIVKCAERIGRPVRTSSFGQRKPHEKRSNRTGAAGGNPSSGKRAGQLMQNGQLMQQTGYASPKGHFLVFLSENRIKKA